MENAMILVVHFGISEGDADAAAVASVILLPDMVANEPAR